MILECWDCYKEKLRWDDCPGKRWYSPGEIVYCKHQVLWLILNLVMNLEDYSWPQHPDGRMEIDTAVRKSIGEEAYFAKIACIRGDISSRLEETGNDGEWLIRDIRDRDYRPELCYRAKRALNYMSGFRKKETGYAVWLAKKRYRNIPKRPNNA